MKLKEVLNQAHVFLDRHVRRFSQPHQGQVKSLPHTSIPLAHRLTHLLKNILFYIKKFISFLRDQFLRLRKTFRRFLNFHSINFEISILYTAILGVILIIFSIMLYFVLFRTIYTQIDQELEMTAKKINQSIISYLNVRGKTQESLKFAVEKTIANQGKRLNRWWFTGFEKQWFKKIDEMDLRNNFINFVSSDGVSLFKSMNLSQEIEELFLKNFKKFNNNDVRYQNVIYHNRKMRVINFPFHLKDGYVIQVGIFQKPLIYLIFGWLNSIVLIIPIILILTSFVGHILAKRILKPVQKIATTARKITHTDLSLRIQIENPYIEMHYLIDDFNNMIARLEEAFAHIEEFSTHVAHELKTPLTIIKGETELALFEDRSVEEYKHAMKVSLEEVDKMLKIIGDLFLLTKLKYQPEIFKFEEFSFLEYFQEIYDHIQILGHAKEIKMDLNVVIPNVKIKADKVHLSRLFLNLLDNAIKFTPKNGRIVINLMSDDKNIHISIKDSGPGISKEDLSKIFDRFYCVKSQASGCGLGLSIAQSIAKIHNGKILVKSRLNHGTTFIVILPIQASFAS